MITKTKSIEIGKNILSEIEKKFPNTNGRINSISSQSHIVPNNEEFNWSNIQFRYSITSHLKSEINFCFDLHSKDSYKGVSVSCSYFKRGSYKMMKIESKWNGGNNSKTIEEQLNDIKIQLIKRKV